MTNEKKKSEVRVRFAPSPTGYLHTGSARTALFNYLYAKSQGGQFLLRVEDTDRQRSTTEATREILSDMMWLGLRWDGEEVHQSDNLARHRKIAIDLLEQGKAYRCYSTKEQVEDFREKNPHKRYESPWRDREPISKSGYAIRLKADLTGKTTIQDHVKGEVSVDNKEMDDLVLLRSDGSPTYMLSVVVDDHDMGITHIIRGDDHLTNTFRQHQIYAALGWKSPETAHIPMILDTDGKKLSKRKSALGIFEYRNQGYLPEAVCNHLLRLGWSHGDDEIISMEKAIEWFSFKGMGCSPSRFDKEKLNHINKHYLHLRKPAELYDLALPFNPKLKDPVVKTRFLKACPLLVDRSDTVAELAENAHILIEKVRMDSKSQQVMAEFGKDLLPKLKVYLMADTKWTKDSLKEKCQKFAEDNDIKFPLTMQTLRAGVVGTFNSPGVFDMLEILGKDEFAVRVNAK